MKSEITAFFHREKEVNFFLRSHVLSSKKHGLLTKPVRQQDGSFMTFGSKLGFFAGSIIGHGWDFHFKNCWVLFGNSFTSENF